MKGDKMTLKEISEALAGKPGELEIYYTDCDDGLVPLASEDILVGSKAVVVVAPEVCVEDVLTVKELRKILKRAPETPSLFWQESHEFSHNEFYVDDVLIGDKYVLLWLSF